MMFSAISITGLPAQSFQAMTLSSAVLLSASLAALRWQRRGGRVGFNRLVCVPDSSYYRCRLRRLVALSCKAILLSANAANAILSAWMTEKPPALFWQSWPRFEPQNGQVKVIGFIGSRSGIEIESFAIERMLHPPVSDEQLNQIPLVVSSSAIPIPELDSSVPTENAHVHPSARNLQNVRASRGEGGLRW